MRRGGVTEVPVTFTIPFADMAEAGLFTATNLRIYYASPAEGGFTLTHARYGHGVGMSQRGAQQMANEGKTYRDILAYYYGGATLASYAYTLPEELEQDGGDPSGPAEPQTASARVKGSSVNLRKGALRREREPRHAAQQHHFDRERPLRRVVRRACGRDRADRLYPFRLCGRHFRCGACARAGERLGREHPHRPPLRATGAWASWSAAWR